MKKQTDRNTKVEQRKNNKSEQSNIANVKNYLEQLRTAMEKCLTRLKELLLALTNAKLFVRSKKKQPYVGDKEDWRDEGELVKSDSGKSQTKEINLELNERHKVPVVRVEHKNRMILM